ncbi:Thioesterase/thiol ester dehydrase-isomerase [Terfezia boudieri ATCC MYA-4762]|uniref:Thioesterase/thiol ester dehydrase-isomerase n=1 Tax=Terfezia boudieri ATCC MYA-4762 TaxID=1051890 RepID=A0A3N4LJZ3_9PEZI|nr:Thioesterase/thiol ester dehydrase-isomerase [Terfezia boudieri ATCC MYA-4762]
MTPKPTSSGPIGSQGKPIPGIPSTDDTLTPFEKVQAFLNNIGPPQNQGFESEILKANLTLVSATVTPTPSGPTSICVFSLLVTPSLCNRMGNLHGGATALIVDVTTTLALAPIARPGFWQYAGVSRTLSVTYLRPAPMGRRVRVVAEVVQAGRTICTLKARVEDEETGRLLSVAEHGKMMIDPPVEEGKEKAKL